MSLEANQYLLEEIVFQNSEMTAGKVLLHDKDKNVIYRVMEEKDVAEVNKAIGTVMALGEPTVQPDGVPW